MNGVPTFTPTLNKVDQHIKAMLLTFPALFNSRMAALRQLFMTNGNGYVWDVNGCLVPWSSWPTRAAMDFSDLDERQAQLAANCSGDVPVWLVPLYAARAAALEREYAERRLIAENIDLYATEHVMGEDHRIRVEWLRNFDPCWCVLKEAPFGALDLDWAAAAEETLLAAQSAIGRYLGMYSPHFCRSRADSAWLRKYDQVTAILEQLDCTTGRQASMAQSDTWVRAIVDEIRAEEHGRAKSA